MNARIRTAGGEERSTLPGSRSVPLLVSLLLVLALLILVNVAGASGFDYWFSGFINTFSRKSVLFDALSQTTIRNMFSGSVMSGVFVYAWFKAGAERNLKQRLFVGLVTAFASGVVSRFLQKTLPTHLRPLHDPQFGFVPPYSVDPDTLNHWSSFPSDHAAVLFGLAFAIWTVNRSAGLVGFLVAAFVDLNRVYLGYHWLTDIIGGAVLGMLCVLTTTRLSYSNAVKHAVSLERTHSPLFFALGFMFLFGVSTLFDDVRSGYVDVVSQLRLHRHE